MAKRTSSRNGTHRRNGHADASGLWPGGSDVITTNLLARQLAKMGMLGQQASGMTRNDLEDGPFTTGVPFRGLMDAVLDPRRSIDEECGYPASDSGSGSNIISPQLFRILYDREPIANRVVQVLPKECFQVEPLIFETEDESKVTPFEDGLDDLSRTLHGGRSWYENDGSPLIGYLQRLDCLSRIGHFGVMLIGVDDGKNLDQPVDGVSTLDPLGTEAEKYARTRGAYETDQGRAFQSGGNDKVGSMPSMGGLGSKVDGTTGGEDDTLWSAGQPNADGSKVAEPKGYVGDWEQWERMHGQDQEKPPQESDNGGDYAQPAWKGPVPGPGHSTSNRLSRMVGNARKMGACYFDRAAGGKVRGQSLSDWVPSIPRNAEHHDEVPVYQTFNKSDDRPDGAFSGLPQHVGWRKADDRRIMTAADLHQATRNGATGVRASNGSPETTPDSGPTNNAPTSDPAQYRAQHSQPSKDDLPAYQDAGHTVQLASGAVGTDAQYVGIQLGPSEYASKTPSTERPRVLFLRNFSEDLVQIVQYEANVRNPRFGLPVMYRITLNDPRELHSGVGLPMATVRVHWSRIIHVNDVHANPGSSEIFSPPAMRPVLNRLLDLRKLYGAGAEGYWQAALTILQFVTHPTLGGDVLMDSTGLQSQVQNVINSLQRYLMSAGGEWKNIAPDIKDNSNFVERCVEAICICLAIPKRVFLGSERGELASSQDDAKWNDVLRERQVNYVTPRIIVPTIDRFILMGVLPEPVSYKVEWPDLDSQTDKDKAGIALQKTQALQAYVMGNLESIYPFENFLVDMFGYESDHADQVADDARQHQDEEQYSQPDYGEPGHPATSEGGGGNEGQGGQFGGGAQGAGGRFGGSAMGGGGQAGGFGGMGGANPQAGGGGAAADENANAIKQAQGKMQNEEKAGQEVSNAFPPQQQQQLAGQGQGQDPQAQRIQARSQGKATDAQIKMQSKAQDHMLKMQKEQQQQAEEQKAQQQKEADERRQGMEDELGEDDVDEARRAAQEAVSQRIGDDPKKALDAVKDDSVEWADIEDEELARRVKALALAPQHALQELQADLAQEVTDKAQSRDDALDRADEHGQAGRSQQADFHSGRADEHHDAALEAKARLEAVQAALKKQGGEDDDQPDEKAITNALVRLYGKDNVAKMYKRGCEDLVTRLGVEKARTVINAAAKLLGKEVDDA